MMRLPNDRLTVIVLTNLDIRSGSGPEILARGIAGLMKPELALPHTLSATPNPDRELEELAQAVLALAASGGTASNVTPAMQAMMDGFPPFVRKRLSDRLKNTKSFRLITSEEVSTLGLVHFDAPVARLAYFDCELPHGNRCYTLLLTREGRVAGLRSYKY
jgi:hypothetical protein